MSLCCLLGLNLDFSAFSEGPQGQGRVVELMGNLLKGLLGEELLEGGRG